MFQPMRCRRLRSSAADRNRRNSSRWTARDRLGPARRLHDLRHERGPRQAPVDHLEREDDVDADPGAFEMLLDDAGLLAAFARDLAESCGCVRRVGAVEPDGEQGVAGLADAVKRRGRHGPRAGTGAHLGRQPFGLHPREQQAEPVRERAAQAVPCAGRRRLAERADHAVEQVERKRAERLHVVPRSGRGDGPVPAGRVRRRATAAGDWPAGRRTRTGNRDGPGCPHRPRGWWRRSRPAMRPAPRRIAPGRHRPHRPRRAAP